MMNDCRFYKSVSKLEKVNKCDLLCNSQCEIIKKYKVLLNKGKIDIIDDIANFREKKHQNKKKRRVHDESGDKYNTKRTLSKSRKKSKNKSK